MKYKMKYKAVISNECNDIPHCNYCGVKMKYNYSIEHNRLFLKRKKDIL